MQEEMWEEMQEEMQEEEEKQVQVLPLVLGEEDDVEREIFIREKLN